MTALPSLDPAMHDRPPFSHGHVPQLVTIELPPRLAEAAGRRAAEGLLRAAAVAWERPAAASRLLGFGAAVTLRGGRDEPLEAAAPLIRALAAAATGTTQHGPARPRFFGGARFAPGGKTHDLAWDGFGGWQFRVPELLLAFEGSRLSGTFTMQAGEADPRAIMEGRVEALLDGGGAACAPAAPLPVGSGQEAWEGMVRRAVDEISAGAYEKVVLARLAASTAGEPINAGDLLARLAERYRNCFVFKYEAGGASWLGASPELLLSFHGHTVRTASLAGSRPRGANPEADARLATELLASDKERAEHEFVAVAVREAVAPLCSTLSAPRTPRVISMPNIHHLYTPIEGRVRPGFDALDLVTAVHPTPAVGGWPRNASLKAIERLERLDRGWYAGPIGWVDFRGEGEFAVALRSALVSAGGARLYAGAGIVAASQPSEEYLETETKLRPLREALQG